MGWGWGLITPGMGWKPMAELVMGVKSDVCFLGDAGPWLGFGLPPPWIIVTNWETRVRLFNSSSKFSESERSHSCTCFCL